MIAKKDVSKQGPPCVQKLSSKVIKARKRALNQSTTLDEENKRKILTVLKPDYMSSDESVIISDTEADDAALSDENFHTNYRTRARTML